MIVIKIILAILFAFLLFVGAFMAISSWIFDKVEISDHLEKMQLQRIQSENVKARKASVRRRKQIY